MEQTDRINRKNNWLLPKWIQNEQGNNR